MNRKTAKPEKKPSGKRSIFPIELTRREALLWLGIASFAMIWMFTLGVIVGRGHSPVRFDVEKIKKELASLREQALRQEKENDKTRTDMTPHAMDFDFYEALTDKKEEARRKSVLKALEEPSEPPEAAESSPKPAAKRSPENTQKEQEEKGLQKREETRASADRKEAAPSAFVVQVASLQDAAKAEALVSSLKQKGYKAYAVTARVPGKGIYHRVRVGRFENRLEASRTLARLKRADSALTPLILRE
jgi:cell division septation protein DedD